MGPELRLLVLSPPLLPSPSEAEGLIGSSDASKIGTSEASHPDGGRGPATPLAAKATWSDSRESSDLSDLPPPICKLTPGHETFAPPKGKADLLSYARTDATGASF